MMEAEHRIGGKEEVQEGTQSKSSDFSTQNDPQTSCTSSASSAVPPEVLNHSDVASVALEVKDQPSTLHSPSATIGERRTYECHQTSKGSDSDNSVEIIEVPKKPVPLICISDSETDNEDKKKSVKSKSSKREEKKMTLQEKLEEYKSKLFPIKQEGSEESASSAEKQDLTCSICLGPYDNRALLDVCFHSFCYTCILQWANVVHTCPLCKATFKSIIHDITPDLQYKQYFVNEKASSKKPDDLAFNFVMNSGRRFHYRSTSIAGNSHWRDFERQRRYDRRNRARQRQTNSWGQQQSRWGHSAATHDRRRIVYRLGMVIKEVKHIGRPRYRDISVEFMRSNPAVTHRFVPWILRDLSVLLENDTGNVSFVLHLILSLLTRVSMESQEFRDQLQPFLFNNTSRFIRELLSFARSPYDMRAYDENVVYDMPSNTSSQTRQESANRHDLFMNPEPVEEERPVSFLERLLDEATSSERKDASPPLVSQESSSGESSLVNVDCNTSDSDLEITRVIHTHSASGSNSRHVANSASKKQNKTRSEKASDKEARNTTLSVYTDAGNPRHTIFSETYKQTKTGCDVTHSSNASGSLLSPSFPVADSSKDSRREIERLSLSRANCLDSLPSKHASMKSKGSKHYNSGSKHSSSRSRSKHRSRRNSPYSHSSSRSRSRSSQYKSICKEVERDYYPSSFSSSSSSSQSHAHHGAKLKSTISRPSTSSSRYFEDADRSYGTYDERSNPGTDSSPLGLRSHVEYSSSTKERGDCSLSKSRSRSPYSIHRNKAKGKKSRHRSSSATSWSSLSNDVNNVNRKESHRRSSSSVSPSWDRKSKDRKKKHSSKSPEYASARNSSKRSHKTHGDRSLYEARSSHRAGLNPEESNAGSRRKHKKRHKHKHKRDGENR